MQGGRRIIENVARPIATAKVNNEVRIAEHISIDRELPTDLPEAVVGTGGFTAATGRVSWAPRTKVTSSADSPWSRAAMLPPMPGDDLYLDLGFEDQEWRQLTGTVDRSSGAVAAASVESTVVDHTDMLRSKIQWPAKLAHMPTVSTFLDGKILGTGLTAISVVDRVMRACGFSATPRPTESSFFSVSLLGDLHPDLGGELAYSSTPTVTPSWEPAPWGPAVRRPAEVRWALYDKRLGPRMDGFEFSVQMPKASENGGSANLWIGFGVHRLIRLAFTSTSVVAYLLEANGTTTAMTLGARDTNRVSGRLVFGNDGATAEVSFWLHDAPTGSRQWVVPAIPDNSTHSWVVGMDGMLPLGGFTLDELWPTERPRLVDVQPNAIIDVDTLHNLQAFPAIMKREGLDLLREASAALCASMWLDEYGSLHWLSRGRLIARSPAVTMTSATEIHDIAWSVSSAGLRRRTSVAWQQPAITATATYGVPLWQASEIISEETMMSLFIHPNGDEDWIAVDTEIKFPSGSPPISDADIVNGIGSWANTRVVSGGYGQVIYDLVELDPQTFLFTAKNSVAGSRVSWSTDEDFPIVDLRNQYTPYLRGRGRVQWTNVSTTSAVRGPDLASDLEHQAGPWIQTEADAKVLADWLAKFCQVAVPKIESLQVFPDLRIQLGDVIKLQLEHALHVDIVGVVVGVSLDYAGAEITQSLSLRIVTSAVKQMLLGDFDTAWRGAELGEQDDFWELATLGDLDNDPTRRG